MSPITCLNCGTVTTGNFCAHCGQKTDTHRIIVKHFILHDILHGVWHFEKGIFFTLKEAIIRPGQAALDYIGGKRIKYYNVFYLSLLMIGLNILLIHFYHGLNIHHTLEITKDDTPNVTKFFTENVKFILFSIVPILALNAYMIFKRLHLNIAEHFIISGMCLLGILVMAIFFNLMNFLSNQNIGHLFTILEIVSFFVLLFYPLWPYFNAVKKYYSVLGTLWRLLLFQILIFIELGIFLALIIIYLTNGKGNFYINI